MGRAPALLASVENGAADNEGGAEGAEEGEEHCERHGGACRRMSAEGRMELALGGGAAPTRSAGSRTRGAEVGEESLDIHIVALRDGSGDRGGDI